MAQAHQSEYIERTVQVRRVTKVVKGGRRFGFSALVVIGDGKGKAGYALGKANEVSEAIKKAKRAAQKSLKSYPTYHATIPHRVIGEFCSGMVLLRPMPPGSGIIACLPARAVIEALGVSDINIKALRSNNPVNIVKATLNGFSQLRTFEETAELRSKDVEQVNTSEY
ncbi:MAG: 30S ribosomal protein S5 [SAR324 cluster bacterium]|nr:30S ribosomal protein S5 [SAR324 cluster bacterium]